MQQISFIRAALLTISLEDHGVHVTDEALPVSDAVLLNEASDIADQIKESAVHGSDGSITWISPTYLHSEGQFQLQPVESGMYGGGAGTALFLAAMENFAPGNGYGDYALKAVKSVQFDVNANSRAKSRLLQNGLSSGIPGICYCLSVIGELLGQKELLQLACTYSEQIHEDLIRNDSCFDILEGTTGTLLALLRLHRLSPAQSLLNRAILCGEHLLHHRSASLSGNRAWKISGKLLTGFSHGAAGIGYALMRLYEQTGILKFQQAAKEAFDYEASVFVESESNWPDFRSSSPVFMNSWCHGATGIALSRAAAIAVIETPLLRRDLTAALFKAAHPIPNSEDDLCCGNAGRIEALLYSSAALSSDDLQRQARDIAAQMLRRKQERRRYAILYRPEERIYNTGLFKGIAGIGYTLLRLQKNGSGLPSVLAID